MYSTYLSMLCNKDIYQILGLWSNVLCVSVPFSSGRGDCTLLCPKYRSIRLILRTILTMYYTLLPCPELYVDK